jgi:cysteinyl-tRNA synthetase
MAELLQPFGGGLACDDPLKNVFDIHGGGVDLVFPHHENEIAQSCCAFGAPRMANVWMHNGFLQVEGEKMSKSLGNFVTIHELLRTTRFGGRRWPGEVLRLAMLRTHYRQPIDWTVNALEEAESTLDRWYDAIGDTEPGGEIAPGVEEALCDDLNTPAALAELHRLAHPAVAGPMVAGLTRASQQPAPTLLKASANLMGLLQQTRSQRLASALDEAAVDPEWVEKIIAERAAARAGKNWKESDRLRDELARRGVVLKDSKDGTAWEFKR